MTNFNRPPRPPNTTPGETRIPANHPSLSQVSFLSSSTDIAPARLELETWLRSRMPQLDEARIGDIVLAASELFCNAIEHGHGGCLVDTRRVHDHLTLTVTNSATATDMLPVDWWIMPDAAERSGRGLAIIRAVADSVQLVTTDTSVSVTAIFDLQNPTPTRSFAAAIAV